MRVIYHYLQNFCLQIVLVFRMAHYFAATKDKKSPTRGLTVIATSAHGLLRPTCNHSHNLLALASAEIKRSVFW